MKNTIKILLSLIISSCAVTETPTQTTTNTAQPYDTARDGHYNHGDKQ